jgi:hypothetical protein
MTPRLQQHHHVYVIPPRQPLLPAPQSSGIGYAVGLVIVTLFIAFTYVLFDLFGSVAEYWRSS